MTEQPTERVESVPLVVDLDGTLLRTDTLWESVVHLAKHRWTSLWLLPVWVLRGKAYFKHRVATIVDLPVETLPFNEPLISLLRFERAKPRRLLLATAANTKIAHAVASHLKLFDEVLASDSELNLSRSNKLAMIQHVLGGKPFDYAANDRDDLPVWRCARRAVLVNPKPSVLMQARSLTEIERVFADPDVGVKPYLRAARLYQWPKNLLVFLPLLAAHRVTELPLLGKTVLAFFAWSLCASAVYVSNDLLDLSNDRQHPKKRLRPLASGAIPLVHGLIMIPILLILSGALGLLLNRDFAMALGLYFAITFAYSTLIKRVMLLDVTTIAGLYTLRVIGGSAVIDVTPTFWLLAFSMFLFLDLALVKRYADLVISRENGRLGLDGRDYQVRDLPLLIGLGTSASYLAVVILALYVNSAEIHGMYRHPTVVWLLCPILLYWTSRVWMKAVRGEMHHDPLIFAMQDRSSWIMAVLGLLVLAFAL